MPRDSHWFEPIADHLGKAYLRYSFTKGTEQEVAFLVDELGLHPGMRILDVGCGPGRHSRALGERGLHVVGLDLSRTFIDIARDGAPANVEFVCADARAMQYDAEFDAAICLCQGAFGLLAGEDAVVLRNIVRALKPGAPAAVSAFSAYFCLRWLEESDDFDAGAGVNHEHTVVRDEAGNAKDVEMWTSVFTPRELRLLVAAAGAEVEHLWSVTPGAYAPNPPTVDQPEWLVVLRAASAA